MDRNDGGCGVGLFITNGIANVRCGPFTNGPYMRYGRGIGDTIAGWAGDRGSEFCVAR